MPQRKTHCKHGHKLTPSNTYTQVKTSKVSTRAWTLHGCKACRCIRDNKRYRENPSRAAALRHQALIRWMNI